MSFDLQTFWKTYFTVVDVLKHKVQVYEAFLQSTGEHGSAQTIHAHKIEQKAALRTSLEPSQSDLPFKRILILEPLERNRVLISHYLKPFPYFVSFAKSSEEFSKLEAAETFDLLLRESGITAGSQEKEQFLNKVSDSFLMPSAL